MRIAIIGGGAAGFFMAINLKILAPQSDLTISEKSSSVLAKVAISGCGICNLTNSFNDIKDLSKAYPRGHKLIKRAFKTFNYLDTYNWFESNGVKLITQNDQCVFPVSQDSKSVIDCFIQLSNELNINIKTLHNLININKENSIFRLDFSNNQTEICDIIAITTGGQPKVESFNLLKELGHKIEYPLPSLFTFNIPSNPIRELMGNVTENALVSLQGTKLKATGALLITHWGMSGPAILKLSSYGAKLIHEKNYLFNINVNWVNESNFYNLEEEIKRIIKENPNKLLGSIRPYNITSRLWHFLLNKINISSDKKWIEVGSKGINKIVNILSNDEYQVHGKGQFRDEFVTCGGVSLESINNNTMESKHIKNLYFAGEILDIDAITGGFNLQAAWTTGYIAAKSISQI